MRIKLQTLQGHAWEPEFSQLSGEQKLPQDYHGLGCAGKLLSTNSTGFKSQKDRLER